MNTFCDKCVAKPAGGWQVQLISFTPINPVMVRVMTTQSTEEKGCYLLAYVSANHGYFEPQRF